MKIIKRTCGDCPKFKELYTKSGTRYYSECVGLCKGTHKIVDRDSPICVGMAVKSQTVQIDFDELRVLQQLFKSLAIIEENQ